VPNIVKIGQSFAELFLKNKSGTVF